MSVPKEGWDPPTRAGRTQGGMCGTLGVPSGGWNAKLDE